MKQLPKILALAITLGAAHATVPATARAGDLILADTALLLETGITILDQDRATGVALAELDSLDLVKISRAAHSRGKCAGFQLLPSQPWNTQSEARALGRKALLELSASDRAVRSIPLEAFPPVVVKASIQSALAQVSESSLIDTVQWLSHFNTRYHKGSNPNEHVEQFKQRIEQTLGLQADLIAHQYTPQKSLRIHIQGKSKPDEIVVIGAHLDSINQQFWSPSPDGRAPGADDNASGSANILEALRILTQQGQPERSIEFFWYAGEEGGLIGSSEIAKSYARAGKKVHAALQLDMTLFAGSGEFVLGSMTDFTSPALRQWFAGLNQAYIGAKIVDDKCGYGCSDHASWHSNGYPALMPFEATFAKMWPHLHTPDDVLGSQLNFKHSAMFSKIALAFAMELGGY